MGSKVIPGVDEERRETSLFEVVLNNITQQYYIKISYRIITIDIKEIRKLYKNYFKHSNFEVSSIKKFIDPRFSS